MLTQIRNPSYTFLIKFMGGGGTVANVVKVLVLLVESSAMKNGDWEFPLHRRCPNDPART